MRTAPNVIITGTPGVGKTVHCEQLAQEIGLKHMSVNQVAKDRGCYETYDEERKSWVVDEDKVRWSLSVGLACDIGVPAVSDASHAFWRGCRACPVGLRSLSNWHNSDTDPGCLALGCN